MTFEQAAARQHNRHSIYDVHLVAPDGGRTLVARTQRKSGVGLIRILESPRFQARIQAMPEMTEATFRRKAKALLFSNGWRLEFGQTIMQEAACPILAG